MDPDMRADYPQIEATIGRVEDASDRVLAAASVSGVESAAGLPGAQTAAAVAEVAPRFNDRRDLLAGRLDAYADAAENTVRVLVVSDEQYAQMLGEVLPR